MTQEEKARAYDEAIKKAESLYKASEPMSGCNVILETIFPELKESEDEKVRKELIKHLKELSDWKEDEVIPVKNPSYYRQWASWLERQGEHANFLSKIQVGDKVTRNSDGVLVNLSQLKRVAKPSEDKQKPIDSYCQENCKGFQETGKCFADGECKAKKEAEQKPEENKGNIGGISANPAWGEEDEELLKWSINNLTELKDRFGEEYGKVGKCIDWLKSLKGRVQPQPKQEWSEEDEEILRTILSDGIRGAELDMLQVNWLKSLRPQSRWKPSDGDIIILEKVIKGELEPKIFQATLQGILEQLKKL